MTEAGNTSAGSVSISNGTLDLQQGLTLTGGTWDMVSGSNLSIADGASLTLDGGTFVSDADLLLAADYTAQEGITDDKIVGTSGNLNLRLDTPTYTADQYTAAQKALLNQDNEGAVLNFLNASLALQDGENLVVGATQADNTVTISGTAPVVADTGESAQQAAGSKIESVPQHIIQVVRTDDTEHALLAADTVAINDSFFTAKGLQIKETAGADAVTLDIKGGSKITLTGGEAAFTGVIDAEGGNVATNANIADGGTLTVGLVGNDEAQNMTLNEVTVSGTFRVDGNGLDSTQVKANELEVNNTGAAVAVNNATLTAANTSISNGQMDIINSVAHLGTMAATGGTLFVDPAYVSIDGFTGETFGTQLLVGEGSVVKIGGTTDDDLRAAMAESGITADPNMTIGSSNSVLALAVPITLGENGKIVVDATVRNDGMLYANGSAEGQETSDVHFGDGSLLIMDASKLNGEAAITGTSPEGTPSQKAVITSGSRLYILNAVKGDMTVLSSFQSVSSGQEGQNIGWIEGFVNPDRMLNTSVKITGEEGNQNVVVSNSVNTASEVLPGLDEEFNPAMNHVWNNSLNNVNSEDMGIRFLSRAANSDYIPDARKAAATIESAARMAFAGAVPQMTKMASDAATNSVVNRMGFANPENGAKSMNVDGKLVDDKALGLALWIAPLWSNQTGFGMEAGNLDYGYNANIGGISLGADYTWANNFRAGLMFNIGGGYAESSGDLSETTNSMTFWGVGAYGGWKYENFAIMGDVSYTSTWNSVDQDIDHRMGMGDLEADIQASAISAGLRFEYKLETQYLDLIPHVGARYMSINTWGYDVDSSMGTVLEGDGFQQNIWTFPVGITFSKELEMNNDWYFKPSVDFTVIPAAGDIKAKEDVCFTGVPIPTELETQMMDYFTWQGGVGLEFGNENMSVGVNYTLQAGQNSTGHGVFGMFRYEF